MFSRAVLPIRGKSGCREFQKPHRRGRLSHSLPLLKTLEDVASRDAETGVSVEQEQENRI